jgi:hypothetical protein
MTGVIINSIIIINKINVGFIHKFLNDLKIVIGGMIFDGLLIEGTLF